MGWKKRGTKWRKEERIRQENKELSKGDEKKKRDRR